MFITLYSNPPTTAQDFKWIQELIFFHQTPAFYKSGGEHHFHLFLHQWTLVRPLSYNRNIALGMLLTFSEELCFEVRIILVILFFEWSPFRLYFQLILTALALDKPNWHDSLCHWDPGKCVLLWMWSMLNPWLGESYSKEKHGSRTFLGLLPLHWQN